MLKRNLLYTGVTRGRRLVVLLGQKKAVAIAVRNASGRRRGSRLGDLHMPQIIIEGLRRLERYQPRLSLFCAKVRAPSSALY